MFCALQSPVPPTQLTLGQPPPPKNHPKHTAAPSATPTSSLDPPPAPSQPHSFQRNDVGGYRAEFEGTTHPPSAASEKTGARKSTSPNLLAEKVASSADSTAHAQSVTHNPTTSTISNTPSFHSQRGVAAVSSQRGVVSSAGSGGQKSYGSAFSNVMGGGQGMGVAISSRGVATAGGVAGVNQGMSVPIGGGGVATSGGVAGGNQGMSMAIGGGGVAGGNQGMSVAIGKGGVATTGGVAGGNQGTSMSIGGGDITSAGGVSGGGSGMLMMTAPSGSRAGGTPNSLSSALTMVSHDQDDSVFSPSSVDDERMKIIEQVSRSLQHNS